MNLTSLQVQSPHRNQCIPVPPQHQNLLLTDLLRQANFPLNTRCGQRGLCDGCVVELLGGRVVCLGNGQEQEVAAGQLPVALRACQHRMAGDCQVSVRIPPRSLLAYQPQIVSDYRINVPRAHDPLLQAIAIDPAGLKTDKNLPDALIQFVADRLDTQRPVRIAAAAASTLANCPSTPLAAIVSLQEDHWLVTAIVAQPARPLVGAAIDIGTTTVAILLIDLASGNTIGRAAAFNQQMHLGDDVVTRITLCSNDPAMLSELQQAVANRTIAPLLAEAAAQAGIATEQIACLSITGNTIMLHLLAGVNPASMGVAPFTAVFLDHRTLTAQRVFGQASPSACSPAAVAHLMPSAAAFIGADLCAGIMASGLVYDDGPSLLVDVGTNGEVILKYKDRMLGCATAAGPAFEGAGLACGIRAGDGAISHINIQRDPFAVQCQWIGQGKVAPTGLCGSAYIDFLAEAHRAGLITPTGRFDVARLPAAASRLIPWNGHDWAIQLEIGSGQQPIVICQRDISLLLQAKAAIAAGILTLLNRVSLTAGELKTVYLAGGFGTHLTARNAIDCGLLPGFAAKQIQTVGNTSLAGAYLALMDSGILDELSDIGRRLEVVELNLDPSFETTYIDQLALPDIILHM